MAGPAYGLNQIVFIKPFTTDIRRIGKPIRIENDHISRIELHLTFMVASVDIQPQ